MPRQPLCLPWVFLGSLTYSGHDLAHVALHMRSCAMQLWHQHLACHSVQVQREGLCSPAYLYTLGMVCMLPSQCLQHCRS